MYQHFRRGSKAGGNKAKEMKFIPESQCDFFCFIHLSQRAKHEF